MLLLVLCLPSLGFAQQAPGKDAQNKNQVPTLGFANIKDVSPIQDNDAVMQEAKLKKELPGNQMVESIRLMHEAALLHEFVEGFKDSKECNGITLYMKAKPDKVAEFTLQATVDNYGKPGVEQTWTWMIFDMQTKDGKTERGLAGLGNQSTGKLTARDVCMTVWEDVDPNHYKKPGGTIE
jgi:hypothetical protein